MKITKKILEKFIREEAERVLQENDLQEKDYTVPKAGWFDDKPPGKEFERLVSYVEHYRKYAVEEIERLRATVKGLSRRIEALELKDKEF